MSSYISSNDNRLYAAAESSYGQVPATADAKRIPAVRLVARQAAELPARRDKTGTRSFIGMPAGTRAQTSYELRTYLTAWDQQSDEPGYGPLVQAALGSAPLRFEGGTITSASGATQLQFQGSHGLSIGQAIVIANEMRFVSTVVSAQSVQINAPFSVMPPAGAVATPTITYMPSRMLPSASIFDCWSPEAAIQRVVTGAAVNEFFVRVNADYHEFEFRGPARDLIDSATFAEGEGGLAGFPEEAEDSDFDYSIVPGHLGQVWLGPTATRFYTLTSAQLSLNNGLDLRTREFGASTAMGITPGQRQVNVNFDLFGSDDEQTRTLYEAARQRSPIRAMFQLGEQPGQLFGAYLKSLIPTVPEFDDSETRLLWKFQGCRAQGTDDDELVVAFG
jgi:hypothetical protein